ncbi:MAG: 30S ribosomal protein S4 [Thermoplasmata archaeon]|nr:30S ribosomal protein S4 [Thermoplasmata archaeon]
MGDPKFSKKKVETPSHPWQGERIIEENEILRKYGLKNKREIWKVKTLLKGIRGQARFLQGKPADDSQAQKEKAQLFQRLRRLGILHAEGEPRLDDILGLAIEPILARRLQTIVYMKGLANTPKQARQFIVHGHISIGGKKVTIPSYLVRAGEESMMAYTESSPLNSELHPERPDMEAFEEKMKAFRGEDKTEETGQFGRGRRMPRGGRSRRGGGSTPRSGRVPTGRNPRRRGPGGR